MNLFYFFLNNRYVTEHLFDVFDKHFKNLQQEK